MTSISSEPGLRVAIDAQVLPWRNGGVAHALLALVRALGQLDGIDTYRLAVGSEEEEAFWAPHLTRGQTLARLVDFQAARTRQTAGGPIRRALRFLKPMVESTRRFLAIDPVWPEVPLSDGFYESLGCDVLHLPWQRFVVCSLPTVYNPHDIQHLHFPQFFPPEELAWRETMYPAGCRFARTVVVGSEWAKADLIRHYGLDPDKVQVIVEGAPNQVAPPSDVETIKRVRDRYRLPETFLLYPAATWPHKNHLVLLEALGLLRDEHGMVVSLVCTGAQQATFWPVIEARIRQLGLEGQVHSLGFIPEDDLRVIQRTAGLMVQPSLFEASSLPIFDAWLDGVPVACSRATALPEQVQDAGILFDPANPRDVAHAIATILTDSDLRAELRARGFRRLQDFSWERAAKTYRAVYRRAAHRPLGEEDRWLLEVRSDTDQPRVDIGTPPGRSQPMVQNAGRGRLGTG